MIVNDKELLK